MGAIEIDPRAERQALLHAVDAGAPAALELARWMSSNPELSLEETETSERYVAHLEARSWIRAPDSHGENLCGLMLRKESGEGDGRVHRSDARAQDCETGSSDGPAWRQVSGFEIGGDADDEVGHEGEA